MQDGKLTYTYAATSLWPEGGKRELNAIIYVIRVNGKRELKD